MSNNKLIKNYLDIRFRDVHPLEDGSHRGFVSGPKGEKKLRFGIMDDLPGSDKSIIAVNRKDIMAIQSMFGLTYQKSEQALKDYIINRLNYDTPNEINVVAIDF